MIGERIRLARESCQLTQQELAHNSDISQGTLSDIEAGRVVSPSPETIEKIARATLFPTSFFSLGPLPDMPDGNYRRLRRGTAKISRQIRAQARQVVEVVQRAEPRLQLPAINIDARQDVSGLEDVEAIAAETRSRLGVGARDPIPNLIRAVERAGVIVVRLPGELPDYDEYSVWPDYGMKGRPIIVITGAHPGDRDRSNVGHGLAHLILHTLRPGIDWKRAEIEAHRFSSALLLPREAAVEALHPPVTLRPLMGVKATFGISVAMTARRAWDLGLITHDQFVSLRKQLSARGWTKNEPVEVTPENPLLISKIIESLAGTGSTTQRASRVSMPAFTYRALASP